MTGRDTIDRRDTIDPEVFRALGVLCEPPDPAHRSIADGLDLPGWPSAEDDDGLFTTVLPPYAAVYLGPEGMLGGVAADRVAGFWRALGHRVPAEPDHLAALLGLYAALAEAERDEPDPARALLRRQARTALLTEHLVSWVPTYAAAAAAVGGSHHADWALLLTEVLLAEAADLGQRAPLSAHLRDVPGLPGARVADEVGTGAGTHGADDSANDDSANDDVDAFVRALLTPARSGIVLTRTDLLRIARSLGLGLRIGERAFVLRRLLEADAVAVLAALEAEARVWADRHRRPLDVLGPTGEHWLARAEATADLVRSRRQSLESHLQEVLADVR